MRELTACPVCGGEERTLVVEYNGLLLLDSLRESELARYDHSMCHSCGLVYATRRPEDEEYDFLMSNFDESLGRGGDKNKLDKDRPLTEDEQTQMRQRLEAGWLVSEERQPPRKEWYPSLRNDRMKTSTHVDLLASAMELHGARVVELRSKTGGLLDAIRQWFGAEVHAVPAFASDQFIIEAAYGIPADGLMDFEALDIPVEGDFDLILAKHMLTHAVNPERLFAMLRERLRPGGCVYLYQENDDSAVYEKGTNLFTEMKAFHFQNFDVKTLGRCLRRQGFEPEFILHVTKSGMGCLARLKPENDFEPIGPAELDRRLEYYSYWRDLSILSLPKAARRPFKDELTRVRRRVLESGVNMRRVMWAAGVLPPLRLVHAEGFAEVNERQG
jgi:SAM-dependent methyltransferase